MNKNYVPSFINLQNTSLVLSSESSYTAPKLDNKNIEVTSNNNSLSNTKLSSSSNNKCKLFYYILNERFRK